MTDSVRQPDLSVYYDVTTVDSETSETKLTNSKVQIVSLYTSRDLTHQIGTFVLDRIRYDQSGVEIVSVADGIATLPFGTLCTQRSYVKVIAPNQTVVYTILSGDQDFLGSKGYITVTTDDSPIRRMDFWFDKK